MISHSAKATLLCAAALTASASVLATGADDLASAAADVGLLDFRTAGGKFLRSMENAEPGSAPWEQAALGYALALHWQEPDLRENKVKADQYYERIIEQRSGSMRYQLALLYRGQLAERVDYFGDKPRPDEAIGWYSRLLTEHPDTPLAPYAALYRAQSKAFGAEADKAAAAVQELETWIGTHPDNPLLALQWMLIADVQYYPLKNYAAAAGAMVAAEKAGLPESVLRDQCWWKTANFAMLALDRELARWYLEKLVALESSAFKAVARDKLAELDKR